MPFLPYSAQTLNQLNIIDRIALRRYLLDKVQHLVGGFGKMPGDPPDLYHSYLGLSTMAMLHEQGLKSFHAALCFSNEASQHLETLEWRRKIVGNGNGDERAGARAGESDGMQADHTAFG